jgi:hypothetical protein
MFVNYHIKKQNNQQYYQPMKKSHNKVNNSKGQYLLHRIQQEKEAKSRNITLSLFFTVTSLHLYFNIKV